MSDTTTATHSTLNSQATTDGKTIYHSVCATEGPTSFTLRFTQFRSRFSSDFSPANFILTGAEWEEYRERGLGGFATSIVGRVISSIGRYRATIEAKHDLYQSSEGEEARDLQKLQDTDPVTYKKYRLIRTAQDFFKTLFALERTIDPNDITQVEQMKQEMLAYVTRLRDKLKAICIKHHQRLGDEDKLLAQLEMIIERFEWPLDPYDDSQTTRRKLTEKDQLIYADDELVEYSSDSGAMQDKSTTSRVCAEKELEIYTFLRLRHSGLSDAKKKEVRQRVKEMLTKKSNDNLPREIKPMIDRNLTIAQAAYLLKLAQNPQINPDAHIQAEMDKQSIMLALMSLNPNFPRTVLIEVTFVNRLIMMPEADFVRLKARRDIDLSNLITPPTTLGWIEQRRFFTARQLETLRLGREERIRAMLLERKSEQEIYAVEADKLSTALFIDSPPIVLPEGSESAALTQPNLFELLYLMANTLTEPFENWGRQHPMVTTMMLGAASFGAFTGLTALIGLWATISHQSKLLWLISAAELSAIRALTLELCAIETGATQREHAIEDPFIQKENEPGIREAIRGARQELRPRTPRPLLFHTPETETEEAKRCLAEIADGSTKLTRNLRKQTHRTYSHQVNFLEALFPKYAAKLKIALPDENPASTDRDLLRQEVRLSALQRHALSKMLTERALNSLFWQRILLSPENSPIRRAVLLITGLSVEGIAKAPLFPLEQRLGKGYSFLGGLLRTVRGLTLGIPALMLGAPFRALKVGSPRSWRRFDTLSGARDLRGIISTASYALIIYPLRVATHIVSFAAEGLLGRLLPRVLRYIPVIPLAKPLISLVSTVRIGGMRFVRNIGNGIKRLFSFQSEGPGSYRLEKSTQPSSEITINQHSIALLRDCYNRRKSINQVFHASSRFMSALFHYVEHHPFMCDRHGNVALDQNQQPQKRLSYTALELLEGIYPTQARSIREALKAVASGEMSQKEQDDRTLTELQALCFKELVSSCSSKLSITYQTLMFYPDTVLRPLTGKTAQELREAATPLAEMKATFAKATKQLREKPVMASAGEVALTQPPMTLHDRVAQARVRSGFFRRPEQEIVPTGAGAPSAPSLSVV